jgi:hypothetical protein
MALMGVSGSTSSVEYSQGVGGFGLVPEYNSATAEGHAAALEYDSFSPLYEATFTHKEYAKGLAIERKLMDDAQDNLIGRKAQALGDVFGLTRAYQCSAILNNAFATVTGPDGVYLCSAAHPTNKVDATAMSNLGSSALSYATVVAALLVGATQKDDRGFPLPAIYDVLYVPPALQAKAYEITAALAKPGTADNDANFLASQSLRVVVDPYLTSATAWFLIDSTQAGMHALWFNRIPLEINMDPASNFNLVGRYMGYARYSYGWDDYRWIWGSPT